MDELGTEILGAIDDIEEISRISKKFKIWLHVDGQLGGSNFLSPAQFSRLRGIQKWGKYSFKSKLANFD